MDHRIGTCQAWVLCGTKFRLHAEEGVYLSYQVELDPNTPHSIYIYIRDMLYTKHSIDQFGTIARGLDTWRGLDTRSLPLPLPPHISTFHLLYAFRQRPGHSGRTFSLSGTNTSTPSGPNTHSSFCWGWGRKMDNTHCWGWARTLIDDIDWFHWRRTYCEVRRDIRQTTPIFAIGPGHLLIYL